MKISILRDFSIALQKSDFFFDKIKWLKNNFSNFLLVKN